MRRFVWLSLLVTACGGEMSSPDASMETGRLSFEHLPYAQSIEALDLGPGSGFGTETPEIVLGPPKPPASLSAASLDVLSLGEGGSIVLGFGDRMIADGPGPDFVVFENAFFIDGDPTDPFEELGRVSVSNDAVTWHDFVCTSSRSSPPWTGCAGWQPTLPYDVASEDIDAAMVGGDGFDLAELGLSEAKYVRITDIAGGAEPTAGFDLDAVGIINVR